ncbi:peptidoglycan-binding LysM domain-containing protein [Hibiscus syriacus]|uniref:Peptidoglycan-binding LysM domain-containing protein n=1 Tax=Hibiscus syriacus TaxID=106335 RepID=A0A6A2YAZ9_HIBSY|nr:peptidoglycan-binding LysM domain-containing protein [Hibiscus syriacus]
MRIELVVWRVHRHAPKSTIRVGKCQFALPGQLSSLFSAPAGVLAFCVNFSIFYVIHSTTAVTFNVAGNLQVAFAVLISWMIFKNLISGLNAVGCGITLVGCTFYGYVRHMLSQQPPGTPRTPRTPRNMMELLPLVNNNDKLDDKV